MKNLKEDFSLWVQIITFLAVWVVILRIYKVPLEINFVALKLLPDAIGVYSIFVFIFSKWLWRISFLQGWLVPFPDLQGTWEGNLVSSWIDPKTKKQLQPIPVTIVIRQAFSSISCVLYTSESTSYSSAALLSENENGVKSLSFNYVNSPKPKVRDRSEIHNGAAVLKIITKPNRELEGEYWTDRTTRGSIQVRFTSKEQKQKFS